MAKKVTVDKKLIGYTSIKHVLTEPLYNEKTKYADCKVSITYDKLNKKGQIVVDLPPDIEFLAMDFENIH